MTKRVRHELYCTALLALLALSVASATTVTWDGGAGNTLWTEPANWSGDMLPAETDDVVIPAPAGTTVTFEGIDAVIRRLDLKGELTAAGGTLFVTETAQVSGTLRLSGGEFSTGSGLNVVGGTLDYDTGVLGGPVTVRSGTLGLGADADSPATFILQAACSLSGVVHAGQTLRLQGSVPYGPVVATAANGLRNEGTIRLECVSDNSYADQSATLAIASGTLLNEATGRIEVIAANGEARSMRGSVHNEGTVLIETGITLVTSGSDPTFAQAGGEIVAQGGAVPGSFVLAGGKFEWTGGSLQGIVRVNNTVVSVGDGLTEPSTLRLVGAGNRLIANRSSQAKLWVEGTVPWGQGKLTAEPSADNWGTIHLETTSDNSYADQSSRLDCGAEGLVNAPGALISIASGAGDVRSIVGRLVNKGSVEAGMQTVFTGTLEAAGGTFVGPLRVKDSDLYVTGSPAEPTLIDLVGPNNRLLTDNLARTILWVEGNTTYDLARLTMPTGVINHGILRLQTTSNVSYSETGSYLRVLAGSLTNWVDGMIDVRLDKGDGRAIEGNVVNEGSIVVEPGTTLEVTGTGPVFVQKGGEIDAQGGFFLNAGRFDLLGGVLKGVVRVYNTVVSVGDELTEPSTLRLVGAGNRLIANRSSQATLWVEGAVTWGQGKLTAEAGAENRGTIHLETTSDNSHADQSSRLDCGAEGLVNAPDALISIASGAGDVRSIVGRLVNKGSVEAGMQTVFTGTLEAAGGTFVGPLRVKDSDLYVTGSPAEPTLIDLVGPNNRLLTDVLARTILWVEGNTTYDLARLTMPTGVVNHGILRLQATSSFSWNETGSYLRVLAGSLTNWVDGMIDVRLDQGDGRVIEGNVVNEGSIVVEPGTTLEVTGTGPVFVQRGGEIDAQGVFFLNAGRFELLGGALKGVVRVYNTVVSVGDGLTEPSTLRLVGAGNRLIANRSSQATLWVEGAVTWGQGKLTAEPGAENRGTIHLETTSDYTWADQSSRLDCGPDGLVNQAGGVVRAQAGAGEQRLITGRLVNRGRVEAQTEIEFVGTLEAAGGTYSGEFLVHDSELEVTGIPAELTTILIEGGNNRLLNGTNTANTELWIRGNPRFGSGVLRAVRGLVNEGVIRLQTTGNDYRNFGSQLTMEGGPLRNSSGGVIRVNPGQGGPRTISGTLENEGTVDLNATCAIGSSSARHRNSGVLHVGGGTATFSGLKFENGQTGLITGTGTLDVAALVFESAGTIAPGASVGTLTLAGTFRQSAKGVVELEFSGSGTNLVHDRLVITGPAYLEGVLRLRQLEGFAPELGNSFSVVTYTASYGRFEPVEGTAINDELKFEPNYQPTQLLVTAVESSSTSEEEPLIVRQPVNQDVVRGRTAWFGVTANGATPLEYQWQFNEVDLPGATDSVLQIASVTTDDAGPYRVVVSNQYGSTVSSNATLAVQQSLGTFISAAEAGTTELPVVSGNGVTIEVFNGIGGAKAPAPSDLIGLEPDGTTLSPFIDFPRPGSTVGVGTSFNRFFAETTTPPEQVSGINAANFILRHQFFLRVSPDLDLDPETPGIDLRLGVGSDDGYHLAVGSVFIGSIGDRPFAWTYKTVSFEGPGLYPVTLLFAANASGSSGLEFGWETATTYGPTLVPQAALYRSLTVGEHLITFEELPVGTVVSNQFAGEGIVFETVSGNPQITVERPTEFVPVSPPNVYADPELDPATPIELEIQFLEPGTGRPATVDFLSFYVIDAEATGAVVSAFDPTGAEIFRQAYHGGGAAQEEVLIDLPHVFRVRVYLGEGDDTAAIDHIAFRTPEPVTEQRFRIEIGDTVLRDVPEPGAGVLEYPGEEDLYTFVAVAGQTVFFDDHGSSTGRLAWELFDPDGEHQFFDYLNDTDPGTRVLAKTGDYQIRVRGADPAQDTGTYAFKLWAVPAPNEFAISIGDTVSEGQPGPGAGSVESPGAMDRYTFQAAPGEAVFFEEFTPPMPYLWWTLRDEDGTEVFRDHLQGADVGAKVLSRGGQYTLEVVGWGQAEQIGTYGFRLWAVPPPDQFAISIGDTVSEGQPGPGAGSIESPGAVDLYTFQAQPGQAVFFEESVPPMPYLWWTLRDEDGTEVFRDHLQGDDTGVKVLTRGGQYTIEVVGWGQAEQIGTYGFRLWAVPPPDQFAIAIGDTVSEGEPGPGAGSIESPGVMDRYTFQAQPGQAVFFEESVPPMPYLWWTLRDEDGAEVFRDHLQGNDAGLKVLTRGGQYTIEVVGWGQAEQIGTYGFRLWSVPPVDQFAISIGDTVSEGEPGPGAGSIESPGAMDRYTFQAAPGQAVFFEESVPSMAYLWWTLRDEDGVEVFRDHLQGSHAGTKVLSRGGTYTIEVVGWGQAEQVGTYGFKLWSELPLIRRSPHSMTVYVGRDATFTVLAESRFPMTYQWRFEGDDIPGATQPVLTLPGARPDQQGTYMVEVENLVGSVVSAPAVLTVNSQVPDLAVIDVRAPAAGRAGQPVELVWTVTNIGIATATGPWTETILLSTDGVPGGDEAVAVFGATDPIAPGQGAVRTQQVTLPLLGAAGDLWFVVRVDSKDQVPESNEANNIAAAAQPIRVTPVLGLQLSKTRVNEGESVQGALTRGGDLSSSLVATLTASDQGQVTIPAEVTFAAGRESASFTVTASLDGVVDGDRALTIGAAAPGYEGAQVALEVVDVDIPVLMIAFTPSTVVEGNLLEGTLSLAPTMTGDLVVSLESSKPDQLAVPRSVVIPAGENKVLFNVAAVEDALIESTTVCTVSALVAGLEPVAGIVSVVDNDAPLLALEVARPSVNEADGPMATTATITRDPPGTLPLRLELESSDPSEAVVPAETTIPAGVASATFPVGAVDDLLLDGNRPVEIRAFLLETATGKRLGHPTVAQLEVIDNEAPSLTLNIARDLVPEGQSPATTGTVSRNTSTDAALTVQLKSDRPGEATVAASVVILAGQTSAVFEISSVDDGVTDGNQNVVITAEAPGLASASASLIVSDVNRPDLVISKIVVPDEGFTGAPFNVTYRESNFGATPATGSWSQRLFLSTDPYAGNDLFLGEVTFSGTVDPGLYLERTLQYRLPTSPGEYWLVVVADATDAIVESLEANNTAVSAQPISVAAAYTATVQTDIDVAPANTPVPLNGHAVRTGSGQPAGFELVNVHIEVRGTRRVIAALTDAQGNFSAIFQPLPGEAGHYEIGAAHPGETSAPVQDTFVLVGMRFEPADLAIELPGQSSRTGHVALVNLTEIPLTGITHTIDPLPPGLEFECGLPESLPPDGEVEVLCRVTSLGDTPLDTTVWIEVTSTEGARARLPLHVAVKPLQPVLEATPGNLIAGMVRGSQTILTFQVRNAGGVASGPIQVLLPDAPWLKLATPSPLESLAPGASHAVSLQLLPPADMALTEYPGALVLTDGQASANVPFRFRALSDGLGALRVSVEDEYTYYAAGAPRVAGARVVVKDALSQEHVAEATADAGGLATFASLHEGYYVIEATAEDHNPNRLTLLVSAGDTIETRLFLSRHTVQYIWNVVPTEIEDRTRITIEAVFETEVPIPVITIEPPLIDLADVAGDLAQVDLKITNHGLIAAEAMRLQFDSNPRWEIKPLIEDLGLLPARSSLTVPVRIRRLNGGLKLHSTGQMPADNQAQLAAPDPIGAGCSMGARLLWELVCGPNRNLYSRSISIANVGGGCAYGGYVPLVGGGGGGGDGAPFLGSTTVVATNFNCHPCAERIFEAMLNCVTKFIPVNKWMKCARDQNKCVRSAWQGGWPPSAGTGYQCMKAQLNCLKAAGASVPGLSYLKYVECAYSFLTVCESSSGGSGGGSPGMHGMEPTPLWQLPPVPPTIPELESVRVYLDRVKSIFEAEAYVLGDLAWFEIEDTAAVSDWLEAFDQATEGASEVEWAVSETERAQLLGRPSAAVITEALAGAFIDRWNRTLAYWQAGIFLVEDVPPGQSADFIALDEWRTVAEAADLAADLSVADGFEDPFVGLQAMIDQAQREFSQPNEGICATVRISIDQDAVLTRDVFTASLELINRSPLEIEGVRIDLAVQDSAGALVSDRFVIQPPALDGFNSVDGTGRVLANSAGKASWLIVPTPDAAPDKPTVYFVSGALAYTQDTVEVRVPLAPTPITVYPSPSLFLQYFHQRDVLADDPFTDQIEPSIPYSLAVVVRNRGAGEARNFRITSAQPKIIENEKGLLVDFEVLATEVAGRGLTPSLTADFGNIKPGGIAIGRWLLRSSLQGLFVDYDARFEHIDGLGDPRLSLIDDVEIHELIRIVRASGAPDDGLPDMLANDFPDDLDLPDTLYLSDGSVHVVSVVRDAVADGAPNDADLEVQISASVPDGWVYLRLPDPGNGEYRLVSVRRSDGAEIPFGDKAWLTDRTFIGGGHRPIYEYTLHILDYSSTGAYTLTFVPPPEVDITPPTSRIATLPPSSYESIALAWSGTDNPGGSGLDSYDIFVSVDGGPYESWLTRTRLTGALYRGALGHSYAFYSLATDAAGNTENVPAQPDAVTTVTLQNTPPTLAALGETTVVEGTLVTVANLASDPDVPPNRLGFSLGSGTPPGVAINPDTGVLRWLTSEVDGPGRYQITVRVTDNGLPPLSDEQSIWISVLETNEVPRLAPISDASLDEGRLLEFAADARDTDWPANKLTYSLEPGYPPGASVDPVTGLFRWRPGPAQGPSTNSITLTVTDNGAPPLRASQTFTVVVNDTQSDFIVLCGITNVLAGEAGSVPIQLDTRADLRQLAFELRLTGNRLLDLQLAPVSGDVATSLQPLGAGRWRCQFDAAQGQVLSGSLTIGNLMFSTEPDPRSEVITIGMGGFEAVRSGGQVITHGQGRHGLVFVIGDQPILYVGPESAHPLVLYGRPGHTYDIQSRSGLMPSKSWASTRQTRLDGTYAILERPLPAEPIVFHRAVETPDERPTLEIRRSTAGQLELLVAAIIGREVVIESADGWTPDATWTEEKRFEVEHGIEIIQINPSAAIRFYRARIE